ncbi:MAG TPA: VOC family protein [Kineosporiaceae bacterium]|nr:VOC family protein [Kineosporiaceae bacterium]
MIRADSRTDEQPDDSAARAGREGAATEVVDGHRGVHSESGALPGEHPGRARNPVVKVAGLAWLEFEKPDLDAAERFLVDFGFVVADRPPQALVMRARWAGPACLVVRRGPRARFVGPAFSAAAREDLDRLARAAGSTVAAHRGGHAVALTDPSGFGVRVVHGVPEFPALPERQPLPLNFGLRPQRVNVTQRPVRHPADVQRLGHVALATTRFRAALDWYLDHLGLIVSDFLYLDGQRERGPVMAFIRCDRGSEPTDHHTLAMALQPQTGLLHSAYQLTDVDEVAASGEFLRDRGYRHAWGIGRHIQGSQIFDYWRDPDRLMFEHFADGDMFNCSLEPGWARMSVSGLAQWGPKATREFTGAGDPATVVAAIKALREQGNEVDFAAIRGLVKAMSS